MTSTTSSTTRTRPPTRTGTRKGTRSGTRTSRSAAPRNDAVGVVGSGRLGSYVAARLTHGGVRVVLLRRRRGATRASALGAGAAAAPLRVVYLCVPEDQIEPVARELARAWRDAPRPRAVLHAAGHLGSRALDSLRELGIAVGVLHPLRAFHERAPRAELRAIQAHWSFAGDARAEAEARWLVRELDARARVWAMRDDAASRRLYHAACVLANNGGLALHQLATELLHRAGMPARAAPLGAAALLDSAVFRGADERVIDAQRQLRGPLARGQVQVVREHVRALGGASNAARAYKALSLELLALARAGKRVSARDARALLRVLR